MSLLTKGGITRLSELSIDADKDWGVHGMSNILELVLGMQHGDVLFRDANIIQLLRPVVGDSGKVLCTQGPLHDPKWAWVWEEPGGTGSLDKWYSAIINAIVAAADVVPVDDTIDETAPIDSDHDETTTPTLNPSIAVAEAAAVVTVDDAINQTAQIDTSYTTGVA